MNTQPFSQTGLNDWAVLRVLNLYSAFNSMFLSCLTYACQSESTLQSCLNVKELLAWNGCDISSLSDDNGTWTHNHWVCKWTLNHLAKLANINILHITYLHFFYMLQLTFFSWKEKYPIMGFALLDVTLLKTRG